MEFVGCDSDGEVVRGEEMTPVVCFGFAALRGDGKDSRGHRCAVGSQRSGMPRCCNALGTAHGVGQSRSVSHLLDLPKRPARTAHTGQWPPAQPPPNSTSCVCRGEGAAAPLLNKWRF
ncbi:hypothetical protein SKAU_G00366250 [Synaphobranchus kaupii]|uniref:Uncharacterized protein n=1 Tax=Synaphobranchus kaupii TaxID=118154 RepID=A0A9Q1EF57_SYNKA|nr:hypothetical protein SKAU_G00366250 [Synaphobranchus kaupii]